MSSAHTPGIEALFLSRSARSLTTVQSGIFWLFFSFMAVLVYNF